MRKNCWNINKYRYWNFHEFVRNKISEQKHSERSEHSERSDWFFPGRDFAIRTVSMETVISCVFLFSKALPEYHMYGLLTKREVKMAGYLPSSFLRVYGPRRRRGP